MHEGCFVTCFFLQENKFQHSGVVYCSKPPVLLSTNSAVKFQRSFEKTKEKGKVTLGSC